MRTYTDFHRGSEWGKWDLHIHSDASDGKMTCEQIIEKAIENELSVIALTDHHTAKNIDAIISLGNEKGISVIPGIEFRTDKGKRSVHIIGLFPLEFEGIEVTTEALESLILSPLNLSRTEIIQKGRKKLKEIGKKLSSDEDAFKVGIFECQVDFEEAANLIHKKLGGLVVVHAGSKSNSLENEIYHEGKPYTTKHNSLGPLKKDLFFEGYIDICEINNQLDNKDFYLRNFNKTSITGSDAHKLDEIGENAFWIKADPTFEGLKQILYEPERVYLGREPTNMKEKNKIIKSVKITNSNSWFIEDEIEFNTEQISIIGGKGSGKTAILDMIAYACGGLDTKDENCFLYRAQNELIAF
jgi:hypothetical protein